MRTTFCLAAVLAAATGTTAVAQQSTTGNGAPSGTHYDLNIIGVSHDKNANMNQASGNVIFVALGANGASVSTNIQLSPGPFQVLDKNGTDGTASFQLPADSTGAYTVWARALAKPGGQSNIVTCADTGTALTGTGQVCSTQQERDHLAHDDHLDHHRGRPAQPHGVGLADVPRSAYDDDRRHNDPALQLVPQQLPLAVQQPRAEALATALLPYLR